MNSFHVGDHISWNSEAHRVSGYIIEVCSFDVHFNGQIHRASDREIQYFIKCDNRDEVVVEKGSILRRLSSNCEAA